MFTWAKFPFVRIIIFLIFGIWLGLLFQGYHLQAITIVFAALFAIIVLVNRNPSQFIRFNYLYGLLISALFLCLGYISVWLHSSNLDEQNLIHYNEITEYIAEVRSNPEPKERSIKVLVEVESMRSLNGWRQANGRVLVYLEKVDGRIPQLGDKLLISGQPNIVDGPKNPHEFDYKRYLENRYIYQTHWVKKESWREISTASGFDIFRYASLSRRWLERIFDKSIDDSRSVGVIKALVLGNKEELDPDMKTTFANAGVMHVLAVSGLHVGIIYLILILLLKPLSISKSNPWLTSVIIILILWLYAFITGMPPSVIRAVTMFSIIEIGRRMGRESSVFNSLSISAFLLLWINPFLITNVSFQLSYIAVTGILLLYKPIAGLYTPENRILRFFWQLVAVSIAAQLATAPLAAYYFNQFPTYFLISNLFVIPAVTILVWGGVVLLIVGMVSTTIASLIGTGITFIINTVEHILTAITSWPYSSIQGITLDFYELILVYSFIGVLIAIIVHGSKQSLRIGLALVVLIFAARTVILTYKKTQTNQIVFYSLSYRDWAVDLVRNGEFIALSDSTLTENKTKFSIKPYRTGEGLIESAGKANSRYIKDVGTIIVWQRKKILIAESCSHHLREGTIFDFILHPNHSRFMDCYTDQNLLIKLVNEDGYYGHSLNGQAFIAELN